jgi:GT2 family glycosyltransferase
MPTDQKIELSVIIVNYNVRHFLEQCLHSVIKASENIESEIFVVDNNSADGSCSMVTRQFPEVRLIRNLHNAGFSAANNQAIRLSKGTFILLLNPDTLVEEDTFIKCLTFMKDHNNAGALGVKMINGDGKLLPESKRALPTPGTAFFKMSGLSVLFPRSKLFNRYYLGHLDNSITSEAEIISGAFMFIRKEALEKTGLLDETFFMYGEDIDLSYRILKSGYKNYYFPEVKIIHYKGESTRIRDINHIVFFYKAMIIFVEKHFKNRGQQNFLSIIRIAVYFWGFIALIKNLLKKFFLPVADGTLLYCMFMLIIPIWENYKFGGAYRYPDLFPGIIVPLYAIATVLSVFLAGGYKLPSRLTDAIKGIVFSTAAILVFYSLVPLDFRFSRAVVLLGGLSALIIIPLYRFLLSFTSLRLVENPVARMKRTVIVGDEEGLNNIRNLIKDSGLPSVIAGRVSTRQDDLGTDVLGNLEQIKEVIRINRINEVIFSTRELTASQIINSMHLLSECNVTIKIAPIGENLIIGSKSVNHRKDIFSAGDSIFRIRSVKKSKDFSE